MQNTEISELQSIDYALGTWIAGAFTDLNKAVGPQQYKEFLSRPVNQQIYRSDADDPAKFLSMMSDASTVDRVVDGKTVRTSRLPVIYYFRKPGLKSGETRVLTDPVNRWNVALEVPIEFTMLPITLDYILYFMAWDKPSLDKLQLAFYDHKQKNYLFNHACKVGDELISPIGARIKEHKSLEFDDASSEPSDRRLYAVTLDMQVETNIIVGSVPEVPPESLTIELVWTGFTCGEPFVS